MRRDSKTHSYRILEILDRKGPQAFGDLREDTRASPSALSYAIKALPGLIQRNQKTRKYEITDSGRFFLRNEQLSRLVEFGNGPDYKERVTIVNDKLEMEPFLGQFNAMPFDLGLIGDSDLDYEKLLKKMAFTLSYLPKQMIREFAEEVGWQRGSKEPNMLQDEKNLRTNRLSWIRDAYNFEITMLLHFNPRKLLKSIPWSETMEEAKRLDKNYTRQLDVMKKTTVQELKLDRNKVLEHYTREALELAWRTQQATNDFISASLDSKETAVARSEEELIEKLTNRVESSLFASALLKKKEIAERLSKMLGDDFVVVPRMIFMVDKKPKDASAQDRA